MFMNYDYFDDLLRVAGERYKAQRKRAGYTLKGIAEETGITEATVRKFEDGGGGTMRTIIPLCYALDIPFGSLFSDRIESSLYKTMEISRMRTRMQRAEEELRLMTERLNRLERGAQDGEAYDDG